VSFPLPGTLARKTDLEMTHLEITFVVIFLEISTSHRPPSETGARAAARRQSGQAGAKEGDLSKENRLEQGAPCRGAENRRKTRCSGASARQKSFYSM